MFARGGGDGADGRRAREIGLWRTVGGKPGAGAHESRRRSVPAAARAQAPNHDGARNVSDSGLETPTGADSRPPGAGVAWLGRVGRLGQLELTDNDSGGPL